MDKYINKTVIQYAFDNPALRQLRTVNELKKRSRFIPKAINTRIQPGE